MPHVNIKHFPQPLTEQEKQDLAQTVTSTYFAWGRLAQCSSRDRKVVLG